jgi:muconolactone delta-isomerase
MLDCSEEQTMEVMLWVKLEKPAETDNKEFFEVWRQESVAALEAVKAGAIKNIWKVAGKFEVIAVLEINAGDDLDAAVHSLPIWKLGYAHIAKDISWTILRPYANWAEQLKELSKG